MMAMMLGMMVMMMMIPQLGFAYRGSNLSIGSVAWPMKRP